MKRRILALGFKRRAKYTERKRGTHMMKREIVTEGNGRRSKKIA